MSVPVLRLIVPVSAAASVTVSLPVPPVMVSAFETVRLLVPLARVSASAPAPRGVGARCGVRRAAEAAGGSRPARLRRAQGDLVDLRAAGQRFDAGDRERVG